MKRLKIIVVVAICVVVAVVVVSEWGAISMWHAWSRSKPDTAVRNAVLGTSVADISYVKLETPFAPTVIRNRTIIALLLKGLKQATLPEPLLQNRTDKITLVLGSGKVLGPFAFSLDREVDSFSPAFVDGWRQLGIRVPRRG